MSDILNEQGLKEVELVIAGIKARVTKEIENSMSDIFVKIHDYIDTDSWMNYRESIRQAMRSELVKNTLTDRFAKDVRNQIFKEHKDELTDALNKDLVNEVERLKETIEIISRHNRLD